MNSSINIASNVTSNGPSGSSSKTSEAIASTTANAGREASKSTEINDSSSAPASFKDSIKKAYDDSNKAAETDTDGADNKIDSEADGNSLPVLEDNVESTAQDDRLLVASELNLIPGQPEKTELTGKIPLAAPLSVPLAAGTEIKSDVIIDTTKISNSATTDIEQEQQLLASSLKTESAGTDSKQSVLSAQLRQLLNNEPATDSRNIRSSLAAANTATGSTEITNAAAEKMMLQTSETQPLNLNTEQLELIAKSQTLSNTAQQQSLPNLPASLLQTTAANAEPNIDALPVLTNTAANTLSSINLQAAAQSEIPEAFGRPAWSQGVGKQVLWMVNQNITSAEIRLNPAHLGPIEILIDMKEDQINVSMNSRHAIVREAMEQALPKLREMLDENGFNLADTDISKHSFAEQREQNDEKNATGNANIETESTLASEISPQAMQQTTTSSGVVDYYI